MTIKLIDSNVDCPTEQALQDERKIHRVFNAHGQQIDQFVVGADTDDADDESEDDNDNNS